MAKDTQNQKVFVPLEGVLRVQDYVRRLENSLDSTPRQERNPALHNQHVGAETIIQLLGLPIEVRSYKLGA